MTMYPSQIFKLISLVCPPLKRAIAAARWPRLNSESDRLATVGCAKVDRLATVGDAREIVAGCGIGQVSKGSCPSLITNATTPQTYLHV